MKEWNQKFLIGFITFCIMLCPSIIWAENLSLVPVGQTVGVTLDMEGVTVVDTTDVEDYDGKRYTPAKDAGIKSGDVIKRINQIEIESAKHMEELVNQQADQEFVIVFERNNQERETNVKAALSSKDGHYKLGIWIKDAASGIGTITYYNPETLEFGALGHGITEEGKGILPIRGGELWNATVVSVQKGNKGTPGELLGIFAETEEKIGSIVSNTKHGLKGELTRALNTVTGALSIAERTEVVEGEAEILSNIEENKIETFSIEIEKINKDTSNDKGIILKITDEQLLEKTGGIVQGMSGSPIIQNGKLVGAVTHVFVNDPTHGYGIFIENMLNEAMKVN